MRKANRLSISMARADPCRAQETSKASTHSTIGVVGVRCCTPADCAGLKVDHGAKDHDASGLRKKTCQSTVQAKLKGRGRAFERRLVLTSCASEIKQDKISTMNERPKGRWDGRGLLRIRYKSLTASNMGANRQGRTGVATHLVNL